MFARLPFDDSPWWNCSRGEIPALLPFLGFLHLTASRFPGCRPGTRLAEDSRHGFADFGGTLHRMDAGGAQSGVLFFGSALAPADDGSGMAHAAARRRGLTGDEADHRLSD